MTRSDPGRGYLSQEQKEELEELAEAVLDEHQHGTMPVEPASIVEAKGLGLVYGHYGDAFDGLLRHRNDRFTVFCNLARVGGKRSRRARFTLAHELGHYFIASHRNALRLGLAPYHPSFCEYESKLFVEQQADCFASNLLLPCSRFVPEARKRGTTGGLKTILALSDHFETSVTATAIRYASLGISPCIVIKWTSDKYGWKWLSNDAYAAGFRKTIEDKAALIEGSATAEAFEAVNSPPNGFFKKPTTAAFWFPFVKPGTAKDVILNEHAIPLGRFGVLTFLFPLDGVLPLRPD
jgi:hypothetical protein